MDIRDVKMNGKEWYKFIPYIMEYEEFDIVLGVSIMLFDIDEKETTFEDIVETVKRYHGESVEYGEIDDAYILRDRLSTIDLIFFQEYAKKIGIEESDYQEQASIGAWHYCENFIKELCEKMKKDGLFERE